MVFRCAKRCKYSGTGNRTRVFPVLQLVEEMKAEYPSLWTIPDVGVVDKSGGVNKKIKLKFGADISLTITHMTTPRRPMPYLAQLTAFGQLETQY
jgi:hypothetical protein